MPFYLPLLGCQERFYDFCFSEIDFLTKIGHQDIPLPVLFHLRHTLWLINQPKLFTNLRSHFLNMKNIKILLESSIFNK